MSFRHLKAFFDILLHTALNFGSTAQQELLGTHDPITKTLLTGFIGTNLRSLAWHTTADPPANHKAFFLSHFRRVTERHTICRYRRFLDLSSVFYNFCLSL